MRDDITRILTNLISLNKKKLNLLEKISLKDRENIHYISSGDIEKLEELLSEINFFINEVNLLDFEISSIKDSILTKLGINNIEFDLMTKNEDLSEFKSLKKIIAEIKSMMGLITKNREKLINLMENSADKLKQDIEELKLMEKFKEDLL